MIAHVVLMEQSMNQKQRSNQVANPVFLFRAPRDPGVPDSRLMQNQEVRVERDNNAAVGSGEVKLRVICHTTAIRFLSCQYVDSVTLQAPAYGRGNVLVHEKCKHISQPVFPLVPLESSMGHGLLAKLPGLRLCESRR